MAIQSKHFVNDTTSIVLDALEGCCLLNPDLTLDRSNKVLHLMNPNPNKVALICGGGSGHEPAHAGFVGNGMLTAAVCGNIFASPNASQVRRALDIVDNKKGTVVIVKNYTGDVLNFGLAKELAAVDRADRVRFIAVEDDVAVGREQGKIVGRRGLAGTVLVYKIAGALAHGGASLDEVSSTAHYVASRLVTIGVGLEHTHIPGTAVATSHLQANEIEIGMGIHNETGAKRLSPAPPLNELIVQLLDMLVGADPDRAFVKFKSAIGPVSGDDADEVVLLLNNLGGLSELELGVILAETRKAIDHRGIKIKRVLSGTFMTSLNMPGFSITLLLLPSSAHAEKDTPSQDLILSLLDQTPEVPGWKWSSGRVPDLAKSSQLSTEQSEVSPRKTHVARPAPDPRGFVTTLEKICHALIAAEPEITRMDTIAGDGDCGTTLKTGASAVLDAIRRGVITGEDVVGSAVALAQVADEHMGGTSGALYSIFFSGVAQGLQAATDVSPVTPSGWAQALSTALDKLYTYTRARRPSRTLVDPLSAFVETFAESQGADLGSAVASAGKAAQETANLSAKAGRSAYVEGDRLKEEKIPDPGAWGVKVILEALI
ncbi:dihydroxyacetone kinase [Punctularia strigosozonata HHB-11173 SS5]|uniref:dihydroxyacetone kinase n=1 Tax=Punctularia strigosozonata (strain HHB-11173) TaxID=741275 RepID=UPI0004417C15|nr:dihydroxyacetone kinase [Punctularia strigosozonata HHB-11173 SS5]EIN05986.1 dihydroxyacetone kinase [Punctularia strigosozonata HHB-11173 SS5]